jgi:hypothetical protein
MVKFLCQKGRGWGWSLNGEIKGAERRLSKNHGITVCYGFLSLIDGVLGPA